MGEAARVTSIASLTELKGALVEFSETSRAALVEAESEIRRVLRWLGHDQRRHWESQIKKRRVKVDQAETELFRARLFADSQPQACIERVRDLRRAQRSLGEAERKNGATRRWSERLCREFVLYRAEVQTLSSILDGDIVRAVARLGRIVQALQEYVALRPTAETPTAPTADDSAAPGTRATGCARP